MIRRLWDRVLELNDRFWDWVVHHQDMDIALLYLALWVLLTAVVITAILTASWVCRVLGY